MGKIVSGRSITETAIAEQVKQHVENQRKKKPKDSKLPFFPLKRSIFFVQSKFQIIPEIDTISIIVEYYNIKCSSVWYHFDPVTVYYKEKTISNPNSDTGMNYVLVH